MLIQVTREDDNDDDDDDDDNDDDDGEKSGCSSIECDRNGARQLAKR